MKKVIQALCAITTLASGIMIFNYAMAIDAQDPKTLCDRFVTPLEKTTCEDQMRALKPDWYLASLCAKQFDDKEFYNCLNITRLGSFSPDKLDQCSVVETTDEGRMNCARQSLTTKQAEAFQPAEVQKGRRGSMRLSEGSR